MNKLLVPGIATVLVIAGLAGFFWTKNCDPVVVEYDPLIAEMIEKVDEGEIYRTVYDLQNFTSRYYGYPGNVEASTYLHNRLSNISGLTVGYQGGDFRNIIATLAGSNASSTGMFMVGAHYDSENNADLSISPGATDNGGGVAIVLELARVMSQYDFNDTIMFALWNAEEGGTDIMGSTAFVQQAEGNDLDIRLYYNFDSSCYDPENATVLDVLTNDRSRCYADIITQHNSLYGIGFNLTYNVHKSCGSDHDAFWDAGYTAVMTHEQEHGPAHTVDDTVDKISTAYAKKNGQLGMAVLAQLAGVTR